jgi:large subunit ribosomal protein L23
MSILDKIKTKKKESVDTGSEPVETKAVVTQKEDIPAETQVVATEKKHVPSGSFSNVLVAPLVSEKAARMQSDGVYVFVVKNDATKVAIKQAVIVRYGVTPTRVHVLNMEGKKRRSGRRIGRKKDWKKAYVTVPKGSTISVHEGV